MNFTTKIPTSKSDFPINYASKIVSLGSCFAENMADKFDYYKFQNTTNPFGIIFNPISIERIVQRFVNKEFFTEKDIFFHNERWHCFEVHSEASHENKEVFLKKLNHILETTNHQIKQATHVIITYGTSWVYRWQFSHKIVANCHKVAQNQFYSIKFSFCSAMQYYTLIYKIFFFAYFFFEFICNIIDDQRLHNQN